MPALGARMTYIAQQRQTVDKPNKEVEQKAELGGALLNSEWKLMAAAGEILMHFLYDAAHCGI